MHEDGPARVRVFGVRPTATGSGWEELIEIGTETDREGLMRFFEGLVGWRGSACAWLESTGFFAEIFFFRGGGGRGR
jgi:hypothetical protein